MKLMRMQSFTRRGQKKKRIHDKMIIRKDLRPGMLAPLFNSRLKLFPGKLKSRWYGPYRIKEVFPYGAVVLEDLKSGDTFKVNGHRVKPYLQGIEEAKVIEQMELTEPSAPMCLA